MSNPGNNRITLSAHAAFRGIALTAGGNITDKPMRKGELINLQSGVKIPWANELGYETSVPFVGGIADLMPLLAYYSGLRIGESVAPHQFLVTSVAAGGVITLTGHPFTTGQKAWVRWQEDRPVLTTGDALAMGTDYFVRKIDGDTFTLHRAVEDTADAGTNPLDFAAPATPPEVWWVTVEFPLTVARRTNKLRTYRNSLPVKFPTLMANGGKLFWSGGLDFRNYPGVGASPGDGAGAFYAETPSVFSTPAFDGDAVLTARDLQIAWGDTAPWNAVFGEEGAVMTFEPSLKKQGNGLWDHATDNLDDWKSTIKIRPLGITVADLIALFGDLQGEVIESKTLTVFFSGWIFTFHGATLITPKEIIYGPKDNVAPELEFEVLGTIADSDGRVPFTVVQD